MRTVAFVVSCRRQAFLLGRLTASGILANSIERKGEKLCFSVPFSQASAVEALLSEYSFSYRRKGYRGAKALLRSVLARPFLLLSFILSIALIFVAQSFVYGYRITGNRYVNTSDIEEVLAEKGALGVVRKSDLNLEEIKRAVAAIEGISFASVKAEGTRLLVEVKEELPREDPDLPFYDKVTSLFSAVVTRVVVESGSPVVRSGDRVKVGDDLISPSHTFTEGEAPAPARGEVWGCVTYEKEVLLPLSTVETQRSGAVFRARRVSFFGKTLGEEALPPFSSYDLEERVLYRGMGVTVIESIYRETAPVTICHDFDLEAPHLLKEGISELLLAVPPSALERGSIRVTQKKVDNELCIVLYYSVEQRIDSLFSA